MQRKDIQIVIFGPGGAGLRCATHLRENGIEDILIVGDRAFDDPHTTQARGGTNAALTRLMSFIFRKHLCVVLDWIVQETQAWMNIMSERQPIPDMSMNQEILPSVIIDVTGWNYAFSQDEITVKQGQEVTINFSSNAGFHDWVLDEFDAATNAVSSSDGLTSVTFVPDQAGSFEYYCSVGSHRAQGMVGTLIVQE